MWPSSKVFLGPFLAQGKTYLTIFPSNYFSEKLWLVWHRLTKLLTCCVVPVFVWAARFQCSAFGWLFLLRQWLFGTDSCSHLPWENGKWKTTLVFSVMVSIESCCGSLWTYLLWWLLVSLQTYQRARWPLFFAMFVTFFKMKLWSTGSD